MIRGDLLEIGRLKEIHAGIADVKQEPLLLSVEEAGKRRCHSVAPGVPSGTLHHLFMNIPNGCLQRLSAADITQADFAQAFRSHVRRLRAALISAHTVCHGNAPDAAARKGRREIAAG